MIGELMREAGVLVGVLAPMEALVVGDGLTVTGLLAIVVVSGFCLVVGLYPGVTTDA